MKLLWLLLAHKKKVNVTGSVSTVGAKEISARPVNSTIEALQGMVPGMNISTGDGGGSLGSDKNSIFVVLEQLELVQR